jgi:hypothetical protein
MGTEALLGVWKYTSCGGCKRGRKDTGMRNHSCVNGIVTEAREETEESTAGPRRLSVTLLCSVQPNEAPRAQPTHEELSGGRQRVCASM